MAAGAASATITACSIFLLITHGVCKAMTAARGPFEDVEVQMRTKTNGSQMYELGIVRGIYDNGKSYLTYPTRDGTGQVTPEWTNVYSGDMSFDVWFRLSPTQDSFQSSFHRTPLMATYGANHNTNTYSSSNRRRNVGTFLNGNHGNEQDGTIMLSAFTGPGATDQAFTVSSVRVDDDAWHHVAMVFSRSTSTASMYVDGVLDGSIAYTPDTENPGLDGQLLIGGGTMNDPNRMVNAKLANFRIWQKGLTASEVAYYKDNADASASGTAALYPLSEGFSSIACGTQQLTASSGAGVFVSEDTSAPLAVAGAGCPAPSPASAVGDPHLQNVHGEKFDLMKEGKHVLIHIPRKSVQNVLLRVDAEAQRLGAGKCADIYFQTLNITGAWADETKRGGLRYSAHDVGGTQAPWMRFGGRLQLKVAHGRTRRGVKYLNLYVKGLERAGFAIGGLLGEDDHSAEEIVPECMKTVSLSGTMGGPGADIRPDWAAVAP